MLGSVGRKWSPRIFKTEKGKQEDLSWKECARCWLGNGRRETQKMRKKKKKSIFHMASARVERGTIDFQGPLTGAVDRSLTPSSYLL
jgi:hypothetical protein